MRAFLWAAAELCDGEGAIFLAQPGMVTRPGLMSERATDVRWAAGNGLTLAHTHASELTYETPPFERAALQSAGLDGVGLHWRVGDLLMFRRLPDVRPVRPPIPDEPVWCEVMAGPMRVRVRLDVADAYTNGVADPRLVRLVDGDILPSVSRRQPMREHVRVWTAGNQVYGCTAPRLFATIANAVHAGGDPFETAAGHVGRALTDMEEQHVRHAVTALDWIAADGATDWTTTGIARQGGSRDHDR